MANDLHTPLLGPGGGQMSHKIVCGYWRRPVADLPGLSPLTTFFLPRIPYASRVVRLEPRAPPSLEAEGRPGWGSKRDIRAAL